MTQQRKPMSDEAKAKIAESVRKAFELKRIAKAQEMSAPEELDFDPEVVQMKDVVFDPKIFIPLKTGKSIDHLYSTEGGVPRATNYILVGDPGVGKSTVAMDIIADIKTSGHKTLFISGEMDRVDLYKYVQRYPKFGNLDILFLGEYIDNNPKLVLEKVLEKGYDLVLLDSFVEIQDTIRSAFGWTSNQSEKWLIDLMRTHNKGENLAKEYTAFIAIQQVNKGGNFVGSNKLKHNTTGMFELRFEDDGTRSIEFTKNRRGDVQKKMYFDLSKSGDVSYDAGRWTLEETARKTVNEEKDQILSEASEVEKIFGIGNCETEVPAIALRMEEMKKEHLNGG